MRKKRTAGLTQQRPAAAWTENKVRVLSTELILERLAGFGIVTSVDEVVQQARAEHVASAIAEGWRERFPVSPHSVDDDFVDLAARVLWERLLPERRSFEQLDARMQAGYGAFLANDVVRACDEWLEVWEGFKPHFEAEMTRVRDVDAIFHGTEYFFNWCQEFENELGNAGVHDPRYWHARIQYVNEFLAQFFAEDDQQLLGNFLRAEAEALWSLGERGQAEERYEALIARLPNFAWGYIGLADCYWLGPEPTPEPKEYARAEAIYQRALAGAVGASPAWTRPRPRAMPAPLSPCAHRVSGGRKRSRGPCEWHRGSAHAAHSNAPVPESLSARGPFSPFPREPSKRPPVA